MHVAPRERRCLCTTVTFRNMFPREDLIHVARTAAAQFRGGTALHVVITDGEAPVQVSAELCAPDKRVRCIVRDHDPREALQRALYEMLEKHAARWRAPRAVGVLSASHP